MSNSALKLGEEQLFQDDTEHDSSAAAVRANTAAAKEDSTDDQPLCPLFMDGLPSNFAQNPQLAAIASLLEDDVETACQEDESRIRLSTITPCAGGGKVSRRRQSKICNSRTHKPYDLKKKKASQQPKASLGEAQLFLSMWKL